jgi:hypothetical protein
MEYFYTSWLRGAGQRTAGERGSYRARHLVKLSGHVAAQMGGGRAKFFILALSKSYVFVHGSVSFRSLRHHRSHVVLPRYRVFLCYYCTSFNMLIYHIVNPCFADVLRRNAEIKDRSKHIELKNDLVEHI